MTEQGAGLWEKWRAVVSEQIASGQSVAAFCKERGVTSSQLFAWKKRLREAEKRQFVEVQVKPAEPLREAVSGQQAKGIEVRLCGGRRVVVEPGFECDKGDLDACLEHMHCSRMSDEVG
jgi:transposase-like protein